LCILAKAVNIPQIVSLLIMH